MEMKPRTVAGVIVLALGCITLMCLLFSGCSQVQSPSGISTGNLTTATVQCSPASCFPSSGDYRPHPTSDGVQVTPLESQSISSVIGWFGSNMEIPLWLPEGYLFHHGIIYGPNSDGRHVLQYGNGSRNLDVGFSYNTDILYHEFLTEEMGRVCINGTEAWIFGGGPTHQLRWCDGMVVRWITGTLPEEDLIRIAESMGPPGEANLTSEIYDHAQLPSQMAPGYMNSPGIRTPTPTPSSA